MENCELCAYYIYDEEEEAYFCEADMDEDDAAHLRLGTNNACPYFRNGDEYAVVRRQM